MIVWDLLTQGRKEDFLVAKPENLDG